MEFSEKALEISKDFMGSEHQSVAHSYNNMAKISLAQGKLGHDIELYQKALKVYRKTQGEAHSSVQQRGACLPGARQTGRCDGVV